MNALELKVPPPAMAAVVALLIYGGDWLWPAAWLGTAPTGLVLGVVALALLIGVAAVAHFFQVGTTVHPHCPDKSRVLVARGVYRFSRNPMYLALLLMLVAWSLHLGWPGAPLGWALFVAWITRFQIRPEERILAQVFGEEYRDYCRRVRRWL
ncbi:methyltransferase family protein [Marinobacterium weihaiense]|uniref:Isoprenylcysteine carboxylmethyltransferase family protein n=1 Tax=Marinobacterium weihaiense TaxID=2851016 RepID=A0ABS6MDF1_9GAMM|nr:isoprenylcysteine carboxylmethyltransferase family protein [Marinobacterium weihaiense]MBV0934333.1 isoprenylcysteine carboxylmethyltransferase family protein [Marinobacterium weihaiense]